MFSKTCEYGIKAVIFIAQTSKNDTRVGVKEISEAIDCPEAFTGKIMQQLSKNGIVKSIKGRSGGFWIGEKERPKINLYDIVRVLDGDKLYTKCVLGLESCNDRNPCPIHDQYKSLRESILHLHKNSTVENLSQKLEENAQLKN